MTLSLGSNDCCLLANIVFISSVVKFQLHQIGTDRKSVPPIESTASLRGPKDRSVDTVFPAPSQGCRKQLRANAIPATLFANEEVREIDVVLRFGDGIWNLFDELRPQITDHDSVLFRDPALPPATIVKPRLHPLSATLDERLLVLLRLVN